MIYLLYCCVAPGVVESRVPVVSVVLANQPSCFMKRQSPPGFLSHQVMALESASIKLPPSKAKF